MTDRPAPAAPARTNWTLVVLALAAPLLVALAVTLWRTPYPVNETIALLEDIQAGRNNPFDPTARAWYRPLYFVTWEWFWKGTGSLDTALALFKGLEVLAPITLVLLFIAHLRPRTRLDAAAAATAAAVLVGASGFRDNLEIPLLMTLVALPLTMVAWMLLTRPGRPWTTAMIVALTLVAIGFKEQGLVLVPVIVAAWWTRAPGARTGLAAAATIVAVGYLAFRLAYSGHWPIFEQSMGLGFRAMEPPEALARFGAFPYGMYAYNALATMLNVLIAEPTSGLFFIARDVAYRQAQPWEAVHVVSSVGMTALIGWWALRVVPGLGRDGWTAESRVAAALLVALAGCGALSIKYSRDRLGGMAAIFYALAAYEALRHRLATLAASPASRRVAPAVAVLAVLAMTWQLRAVGTLEASRHQSDLNVKGWLTEFAPRTVEFKDRAGYLGIMSRMRAQGTSPAAVRQTAYPPSVLRLLGPQPE